MRADRLMRELCKTHGLVLAPDGKCILCRRPQGPVFALTEEQEGIASKTVTALLGACLLAAAGAFIYASQLPPGYAGERRSERSHAVEPVVPDEPDAAAQPASTETEPEPKPAKTNESRAAKPKAAAAPAAAPSDRTTYPGVEVTMYAAPWCYICDRTRDFLRARDVVLVERDIERDTKATRELAKLNPHRTLPTLQIGPSVHVGFNPWELEDALRAAASPQRTSAAQTPR
jgi:glutaredoxin